MCETRNKPSAARLQSRTQQETYSVCWAESVRRSRSSQLWVGFSWKCRHIYFWASFAVAGLLHTAVTTGRFEPAPWSAVLRRWLTGNSRTHANVECVQVSKASQDSPGLSTNTARTQNAVGWFVSHVVLQRAESFALVCLSCCSAVVLKFGEKRETCVYGIIKNKF